MARVYKGWEAQQVTTFGRYVTFKLGDGGATTRERERREREEAERE
jgi:hypothetical protein